METGRDCILKEIRHIQPEVTHVNVGGIYDLEGWHKSIEVRNERALRAKLNVDIKLPRPVNTRPISRLGLGIFGTPVKGVYRADGVGCAESRGLSP